MIGERDTGVVLGEGLLLLLVPTSCISDGEKVSLVVRRMTTKLLEGNEGDSAPTLREASPSDAADRWRVTEPLFSRLTKRFDAFESVLGPAEGAGGGKESPALSASCRLFQYSRFSSR